MKKVWFITGANKGFGYQFAKTALERGDSVAATSRNIHALNDLVTTYGSDAVLPLAVDVTNREAVFKAIDQSVEKFGRLDIVVNNAGYGLFGMVEEITEQQLRDQMEVNLYGSFHVIQATLPVFRKQQAGHIIQISTIGGIAAYPDLGGYHASKWAIEGLCESLAQEVAKFNIKVTLIEPGAYATDWAGSSAVRADEHPAYHDIHVARNEQIASMPAEFFANPEGVGPAILKIADAENPPLRVLFGKMPTELVPELYKSRLQTWDEWKSVSIEAQG